MTLTKRERQIATGLGATIALLIVWEVVVSPYFDRVEDVDKQYATAIGQQADISSLFNKRERLKTDWTEITQGGLKSNASDAASQLQHAIIDWESASGVTETTFKPERTTDADQFSVLSYHLTESGSTWAIAKLLAKFESAPIPVRVNDVQITPQKEGTDDLLLQLSVSTLCLRANAGAGASSNAGEVR